MAWPSKRSSMPSMRRGPRACRRVADAGVASAGRRCPAPARRRGCGARRRRGLRASRTTRLDPGAVQQMREQQPGRPGPDDPDLRAHGASSRCRPRCRRLCRLRGPWQGSRHLGVRRPRGLRRCRWRVRLARGERMTRVLYDLAGRRPGAPLQPLLLADPHGAGAQGPEGGDHPLAFHREGPHRLFRPGAGAGAGGRGADDARSPGPSPNTWRTPIRTGRACSAGRRRRR